MWSIFFFLELDFLNEFILEEGRDVFVDFNGLIVVELGIDVVSLFLED